VRVFAAGTAKVRQLEGRGNGLMMLNRSGEVEPRTAAIFEDRGTFANAGAGERRAA